MAEAFLGSENLSRNEIESALIRRVPLQPAYATARIREIVFHVTKLALKSHLPASNK